ncbi:hypothetical protein P3T76_000781 [Phytophthora citrophthora]|uniref:Uncharacterized protein n=1 Tax=Phytophthora citrophthora TaxID=4793 RepID=A0AAD9H0W2_9STRA|nr:hypothetical protein P3T76_000781 [Phytophthora citrophthora]
MELEANEGDNVVQRLVSLKTLVFPDKQLGRPEDCGDSDIDEGGETSRVQESAIAYSRFHPMTL